MRLLSRKGAWLTSAARAKCGSHRFQNSPMEPHHTPGRNGAAYESRTAARNFGRPPLRGVLWRAMRAMARWARCSARRLRDGAS